MIRKCHALFLLHADSGNPVADCSTNLTSQRENLALGISSVARLDAQEPGRSPSGEGPGSTSSGYCPRLS